MKIETELMRGAGPMAVLKLLERGEMYGYELVEALSKQSDGVLKMGQSTLYPMLYNLEAKEFVSSRVDTQGARPRKYYKLTSKGEARLAEGAEQWRAVLNAMMSLGIVKPGDTTNAVTKGVTV